MLTRIRHKKYIIILAGLIVIAVLYFAHHHTIGDSNNHRLMAAKRSNLIQRVTIAGKVVPNRKTVITAPYDGYVKTLYVKVGEKIKAGEPVVSIVNSLQSQETVYPIRAPYAGTVVLIPVSEGEFVKKADSKNFLVEIDDLSQLYINADAPEIDIPKIRIGQKALIRATPLYNQQYKGVITTVALAGKSDSQMFGATRTLYPIKIKIITPDKLLKPGMSSIVDIISNQRKNVIVLPHAFVHQNNGKPYVILASGKKQFVRIGLQNQSLVEIIKGLKVGDKVQQIDFFTLPSKQ